MQIQAPTMRPTRNFFTDLGQDCRAFYNWISGYGHDDSFILGAGSVVADRKPVR